MKAALALGSNLGDRRAHLDACLARLRERVRVLALSRYHETEPAGGPAQGPYLNAAVVVETDLEPAALLALAQELEAAAGRARKERWGPRTLDVDVLLCDDRVVDEPGLRVPHPRMAERAFVLEPLAEIAPDWVVPNTGKTVRQLADEQP